MKPHIKIHPIKPSEGRAVTPLPAGAHGVTRPTGNVHAQYALHKELRPDPGQPRQEFPAAQMSELVADIEANGIQEALSVRKDPEGKTPWLINDGERRWRAAGLLSLARVPIVVREFKDEAALRAYQRIVGTQRTNLSDLEAAAALDRELKLRQKSDPKFSITQLGEALGIARATIYESFKLLKLSPPVVAALKAGTIDASKARLFATVPVGGHADLLKQALQDSYGDGSQMSVRQLQGYIERNLSRQLSAAPWKLGDEFLHGPAGPCTTCPKRSGNIEGMGGNPNVCTDVKCYEIKLTNHTRSVLTLAKKDGQRIVPAKEYNNHGHDFATADQKCYRDGKNRTYAQLAKHAGIEPAVTVDNKGAAVKVFTAEDKAKILKANKISVTNYAGSGRTAADKAREKKEKAMKAAAMLAAPKILEKFKAAPALFWPFLAAAAYHTTDITRHDFAAKRRGLSKTINESRDALKKWLKQEHTPAEYAGLVVELLLCANWQGGGWQTMWAKDYLAVAKLAGVNLEKLLTKHQTPNTKHQTPKKTPNTKHQTPKGKR